MLLDPKYKARCFGGCIVRCRCLASDFLFARIVARRDWLGIASLSLDEILFSVSFRSVYTFRSLRSFTSSKQTILPVNSFSDCDCRPHPNPGAWYIIMSSMCAVSVRTTHDILLATRVTRLTTGNFYVVHPRLS